MAVLGGGAGGLAAAFELTDTEELRERFQVTVYQCGWRLGGKGASGRGGPNNRIEEHGLHVWFGFYDDAFGLVRRAYEALGQDAPEVPWTDAFTPIERLVLWDEDDGKPRSWSVKLPAKELAEASDPPSVDPAKDMGERLVRLWKDFLADVDDGWAGVPELLERAVSVASASPADDAGALRQTAWLMRRAVDAQKVAEGLLENTVGAPFRLKLLNRLLDFWTALLTGLVEDRVLRPPSTFDPAAIARLDELDLREWMRPRLEFDDTLDWSFVRVLYDLAFAYRGGDPDTPDVAAGMAVQNLFRILFEHHGAVMLRMEGGMGDVIFAPIYDALVKRGVEFRFFHRVSGLGVSADGKAVETIDVVEQAALAGDGYEPLVEVDGVRCWPSRPALRQLAGAAALRAVDFERGPDAPGAAKRTLTRGEHFDSVVLAIPPGGLAEICDALSAASPRFADMLENSHTVATQAVQLWLDKDATALGLAPEPRSIGGGMPKPFDTYCDMSHLIARESWPEDSTLTHIAYFCGVLPENGDVPAAVAALVADRIGDGGVEDQWFRANDVGSERYVITPRGSTKHRLPPGRSGFANVVLAGDWTRTPVNAGSVEAAVRSGRAAAAALIAGAPEAGIAPPVRRPGPLRYVEYGGLTTAPGPLDCHGTTLYGFWADCKRDRLQALCKRVFEEPSGGAVRCEPIFDHAIVTFGTIERIRPVTEPFDRMGEVEERHAAIWIPVRCRGPEGTPPIGVFLPYLWLDDPISVASGREVYGYAKNYGWPVYDPEDPDCFELDAWGMPELGRGARPARRRLLEIRKAGFRETLGELLTPDLGELVELGRDTLGGLRMAAGELADPGGTLDSFIAMMSSEVNQLFLRQFRSPEGGDGASELQIVNVPARIVPGTLKPHTLGPHRLELSQLASHPLASELGLESGPLPLCFRVEMDFRVETGQVLWSARG